MHTREITYEDFDGDTVTEVFYFHINKPELIELEAEYKGGLQGMIEQVIKSNDNKEILGIFKRLLLLAYGKKSDDGRHFEKSDELRKSFSQSAAYPVLFMELLQDSNTAAEFFMNVIPKDMRKEIEKEEARKAKEAKKAPSALKSAT